MSFVNTKNNMKETFLYILTVAYGMGGLVTFAGFFPTIKDLWHKKPSANASTYTIWTITTFLASLYGFFILQNLVFNIVVNLQLAACLTVLILRLRLKKHIKAEHVLNPHS